MEDALSQPVFTDVRFSGDVRSFRSIMDDAGLQRLVSTARRRVGLLPARREVLSSAVRIEPRLLPELHRAIGDVLSRTGEARPFETFVYCDSGINASVMPAGSRNILMLSSAAVERLKAPELDFVIGHELGHARFDHFDIPVAAILDSSPDVTPRQAMQLLAWQRKAEISADRAGLISCGSLAVAATALFKTLSGLNIGDLAIDPVAFGDQWNELATEVAMDGAGQHWIASHPFPPLRMKALLSFWRSDRATQIIPSAPGGVTIDETDREIEGLLSMMDPLAREAGGSRDAVLEQFLLWGGLYIAAANGVVDSKEIENIRGLVGTEALAGEEAKISTGSKDTYRKKFLEVRAARRKPLTALELHRIFSGLVTVARADGSLDGSEKDALRALGTDCGISTAFVEGLFS